jgi:hypothetical protein
LISEGEEKILTLTEEDFDEYEMRGYFEGVEYRWYKRGGTYTVYIPKAYYAEVLKNIKSYGMWYSLYASMHYILRDTNNNIRKSEVYFRLIYLKVQLILCVRFKTFLAFSEEAKNPIKKQVVRKTAGIMFVVTQTKVSLLLSRPFQSFQLLLLAFFTLMNNT